MKEWLTAREIAAEKLPFIPDTKRGITLLADRENWNTHPYARPRQGRGGGMEYRYLILPVSAQMAYVQKYQRIGAEAPVQDALPLSGGSNLTARGQLERDARLAILKAFEDFLKGMKARARTLAGALYHFSTKYNNQSLHVEPWVREAVPSISPRSLMRWRASAKTNTGKLAFDRSKARKGTGLLATANNGEVRLYILAWIVKAPHLSADIIRGYCEDHFGAEIADRNGELKPLPPPRTFQHFIAALREAETVVITKMTDPDSYRSTMKLSGTGTHRDVTEPNALWMIDASPVDALCTDGRHSLYACIDIATRRLVITLSKTPRASAVGLMMRKAILKWGPPQAVKTDNGSDFVAIWIKQLFANLAIDPDVSDAYSPEQKGHVERVIRTFQHEVCPQLPGYVGHSVADRKAIEGRKSFAERLGADEKDLFQVELSAAELQVKIDDWLDYVYSERGHSALKDRSPNAVAAASTVVIKRVDERALDGLLMPVAGKNGRRKMTKQGIKNNHFHYLSGSIMVGAELFCRLDPIDMGRMYVFDLHDGRFLDVALCAELADVNPVEFVKAQKQIQADDLRERERELKAVVREINKGPSGIDRTIRLAKKKFQERAEASANVIQLPKREESHTTPAIAAAIDAATLPAQSSQPRSLNEAAAQLHEALVREAENRGKSTVIHLDPDASLSERARKYKWAIGVETRIAAGEPVDDVTAVKLVRFQGTADYQTIKDCHRAFGLENALTMN